MLAAERHLRGPLAGATVVVLGASGTVGRAILAVLVAANAHLERPGRVVAVARHVPALPGVEVVEGSTTDAQLYGRLPPPDYVVYLAGTTSDAMARARETIETTVDGALLAGDYAAASRGFAFASSTRVYGPYVDDVTVDESTRLVADVMSPGGIFEASKRVVEGWIALQAARGALPGAVVRLANIYGPYASRPRASFVGGIVDEVVRTGAVKLRGHPESTRSYCFSIDAADGILRVLAAGRPGSAYNIGSRENLSNLEFVGAVARLVRPDARVEVPDEALAQPRSKTTMSIERAASELGYEPRTALAAAMPSTVAWTKAALEAGG